MELKAGGNTAVGALSELFFYSLVLLDVLRGGIAFDPRATKRESDVRPEHVLGCARIEARLLMPPVHPLLHPGAGLASPVFAIMNARAKQRTWPVRFGTLDICRVLGGSGQEMLG